MATHRATANPGLSATISPGEQRLKMFFAKRRSRSATAGSSARPQL